MLRPRDLDRQNGGRCRHQRAVAVVRSGGWSRNCIPKGEPVKPSKRFNAEQQNISSMVDSSTDMAAREARLTIDEDVGCLFSLANISRVILRRSCMSPAFSEIEY